MFGKILNINPLELSDEQHRSLLSEHGVLIFRNHELSHEHQKIVMEKYGKLQDWREQKAPLHAATGNTIINLHNNDWLGKSRMGWHMDQTHIKNSYLPVRSLYCSYVDSVNVTEFADIKYLTDRILVDMPEFNEELSAGYREAGIFTYRSLYSYCDHVSKLLLRYDSRIKFSSDEQTYKFKVYCENILNGNDIPKIAVQWKPFDMVIFDNNQTPHRRSVMNGECKLIRTTAKFWLE